MAFIVDVSNTSEQQADHVSFTALIHTIPRLSDPPFSCQSILLPAVVCPALAFFQELDAEWNDANFSRRCDSIHELHCANAAEGERQNA